MKKQTHKTKRRRVCAARGNRRGMTLIEVLVTGILLGTVVVIAVPTLGWVVRERRSADQRQQATLEVENIIGRFTTGRWDEITNDNAAKIELADSVGGQLPHAVLTCRVDTKPEAADEKRVSVELTWSDRTGHAVVPVRLTTWVYRGGRRE